MKLLLTIVLILELFFIGLMVYKPFATPVWYEGKYWQPFFDATAPFGNIVFVVTQVFVIGLLFAGLEKEIKK